MTRKKPETKQNRPARPRNPFWRIRRLLGARKRPAKTDYRRAEQKQIERDAKDEPG